MPAPEPPAYIPTSRDRGSWAWAVAAAVLVVAVAAGGRYATRIRDKEALYDEVYLYGAIEDLIVKGWSVETAIDYRETKGPALIWTYALAGAAAGSGLDDMRLVSAIFFAAGVVPLVLLCRRCGLRGSEIALAALFYALLPHNAALGQLVMSEPSFVFGALWLMWAFAWGFGPRRGQGHPAAGPIVFGVILAALLHHRIHAAAFGCAACLVAFERDRVASWPWWAACAAAALLRVPLWLRWGGLVAPEFQGMHSLGLGLDGVTYLVAALAPWTAIFLWPGLVAGWKRPRALVPIGAGAVVGMALAIVASPDLGETLTFGDRSVHRFLGFVATAGRTASDLPPLQGLVVAALAIAGGAGLGALAGLAWSRPARGGLAARLAVWTLAAGCAMYLLTRAYVFDRYLLSWGVLMPLVWVALLPRPALALQGVVLGAFAARHAGRFLF